MYRRNMSGKLKKVVMFIRLQILLDLLSFRAGFSVAAVAIDRVLFCFGLWLIERGIKYLKRSSLWFMAYRMRNVTFKYLLFWHTA